MAADRLKSQCVPMGIWKDALHSYGTPAILLSMLLPVYRLHSLPTKPACVSSEAENR